MKTLVLIFLVLGSLHTFSQRITAKTDVELIPQLDAFLNDLIKTHNGAKAYNYYSDNFVLTTTSGETKDKRTVVSEIASPAIRYDKYETLEPLVRIEGETALFTGVHHEAGLRDGKMFDVKWLTSSTWIKQGKFWKLLTTHETSIP